MRATALFLRVGAKNTGKTTQSLEMIRRFVGKGIPVLVLNKGGQEQYERFQEVALDALPYWRQPRLKAGVWQCRTTEVETFLSYCHDFVRNAAILLEDVTPYFEGSVSKVTKDFVLGNRNASNDVVVNLHTLEQISPTLWRAMPDYLFIHHTTDNVEKFPDKIPSHLRDVLQRALYEIDRENRTLYPRSTALDPQPAWRLIDLGMGQIIGRSNNRFIY